MKARSPVGRGRTSTQAEPLVPCPVAAAAQEHPDAPALRFGATRLSYAQLDREVGRWERALAAYGLRSGDRVALLSANAPEVIFLLHAAARARTPLVLLNARLTAAELAPLLVRARPALLLVQTALFDRLPGAGAGALEGFASTERERSPSAREPEPRYSIDSIPPPPPLAIAPPPPLLDPSALHTLLFTSGSEGAPKLARLRLGDHLASASASNALLRLGPGSAFLCSLPLFHVGGLAIALRCALSAAELVLHDRFDPRATAAMLASGEVTHLSLVAATLTQTLDALAQGTISGSAPGTAEGHGAASTRCAPAVVAALIGGGAVPHALLARAAAAGLRALQTYGLTEAASQVCTERLGQQDGLSCGPPLPGTEVRIRAEDGSLAPVGTAGLIELRGPTLMDGYDGDPTATAAALSEGWLRTGDLGTLDARGRLAVHARRRDLIISGGENIYPAEVEAALLAHPLVADAAVLPWPDPRWGQVGLAAVVLRDNAAPSTTNHTATNTGTSITSPSARTDAQRMLENHCRALLAGFKVPHHFHLLSHLPRTASGKIDRPALQAALSRSTSATPSSARPEAERPGRS